MSPGSVSLKTQLVSTIVGSIVATAAALTTLAYRAQIDSLEHDARRTIRVAAQSRADAISRLIDGQQQRAQRFLATAASLCGELAPSGRTAWEIGCAGRALRELRTTERAVSVLLIQGRRRIARSGAPQTDDPPVPTPLARLVDDGRQVTYVIRAESKDSAVRLKFTLDEIAAMLDQPLGLGTNGEVFLRDVAGTFLTPPRFGGSAVPVAFSEWSHNCADAPSEWAGIDYRGIETLHGIRAVSGFSAPICVDAHVAHEEAVAPAAALLPELAVRAAQFAGVGVVLALIAAHWMSAPVQRLAASARAIEAGDFVRPIPAGGPSEVQALARAFAAMARALSEQMGREQRARHDAEAANLAKDEFLAVLSHELRTPLTSTLGWTRLLRHGRLPSAQAEHAVAAIERSAHMQKRLIEDLLDVSRIVAGRLQLDRVAMRISEPIRAAIDELRPIAQEKGIAIDAEFDSAATIVGDPMRIQQIVANLLANAVKFTAPGGRVALAVRESESRVEIVVSDTGVGITPEFLPHIFEPFRQADAGPRRAYGGLGLGLSIVRHLVTQHGGTIEATSEGPGTGANFVVRLPKAAQADGGAAVAPRGAESGSAGSSRPRPLDTVRVLVVEDEGATRNVIAALLEDAGARVDAVSSAAEARQLLHMRAYSAIVSDLAMPHEDGYSFIRAVRRSGARPPALALTGLTRREDATAAYEAGFQACLTKPIDRDKLIDAVAELTLRRTA